MEYNFIDLHCHSTYSDGNHDIEQLIKLFKYTHTNYVSITDHDDLRSIKKLSTLNTENITFISGVELSTVYFDDYGHDYYIHILGYGVDINHEPLKQEIYRLCKNRYENNVQLLNLIEKEGVSVPKCIYEQVRLENYNSIITEFKKCLHKNNYNNEYIKTFIDIAKKFIPRYDNYEIEVFKAIKLIRQAGGVPVLAHPQKIKFDDRQLFNFIKKAKKNGLMGIEVYYSEFDNEIMQYNKCLAEHFGLLQSVGSDFHIIDNDKKFPGLGINHNLCKTNCSLLDYLLQEHLTLNDKMKDYREK